MEKLKLIGRGSRLSQIQINIVKERIESFFPEILIEIVIQNSRGDQLQDIPLHTVEGIDFFTQDIFDALKTGKADIAVHSLKDMSGEHFFGENYFAVVDRDDIRDVAIFNSDIEEKIRKGEEIVIGTCSPRREQMAIGFIRKALPQLSEFLNIVTKPIRGNVETRLRKLDSGDYDGTILATAGINRLLKDPSGVELISKLIIHKKLMLLPLIECVPAPCQGAIVAEANPINKRAIDILKKINNAELFSDCYREKKEAMKYGAGCIQRFGVTTINTSNGKYMYAAGEDAEGTSFIKWDPLPPQQKISNLFSSTDLMKDFFDYQYQSGVPELKSSAVFIANYKAVTKSVLEQQDFDKHSIDKLTGNKQLRSKLILGSGTRTWFELAKKGFWVTACADGLGFENFLQTIKMPLFNINASDITILTHEDAVARWKIKGYNVISNYKLVSRNDQGIVHAISQAEAIFWTSYSQFENYGQYAKVNVKHMCPGGETADLLKQQGIEPVIFPTIKAFELWRKYFIRSHNVV